jgi:very-short-patch-repair endonuclease
MTEEERILWSKIRNKQIGNINFRRQEPIGNYIVDFVSFEKK